LFLISLVWIVMLCLLSIAIFKGPDVLDTLGVVDLTKGPKNPYSVLDVSSSYSESDIRAAYKKKALQWHPDRNPNCGDVCVEKMQEINKAFEAFKKSDFQLKSSHMLAEKWMHVFTTLNLDTNIEFDFDLGTVFESFRDEL